MANLLKMALIEAIQSLHQRGWSQRRIARELGIDRQTVARYVPRPAAGAKPAIAPPGSAGAAASSKPAIAPPGSAAAAEEAAGASGGPGGACGVPAGAMGRGVVPCSRNPSPPGPPDVAVLGVQAQGEIQEGAEVGAGQATPARGRPSLCEPWRRVIEAKLAQELSAQRIYQDLVGEHGYSGSYYSVRRFVGKLNPTMVWPVRRLECAPGEQAQVDFGTGAWIRPAQGKRRRSHVFRIVLSHSRKGYSEAVLRQTTETFLRCLENAFWHFGGVPRVLVLDNLKAAVEQADWFDPELNPKFASFCAHYGMAAWPTRPRRPEHKGKVERGVGYVQDNGLKGREFACLEEENRHLADWEASVADTRIHGTTKQQVGQHFVAVERPALSALPLTRFPFFHEGQRTVNRDGHIEVERAYYSLPPEYLGRRVWVRWDGRLVRIFTARMEPITTHVQRPAGQFSTQGQHLATEKISVVERGAAYLLQRISRLGPEATGWAEAVLETRGIEGIRVLQGLWSLTRKYDADQIARACAAAHAHACYRLRSVRQLLERPAAPPALLPFLEEHPLIRPLADYERFLHHALQQEKSS
jgi:transposase